MNTKKNITIGALLAGLLLGGGLVLPTAAHAEPPSCTEVGDGSVIDTSNMGLDNTTSPRLHSFDELEPATAHITRKFGVKVTGPYGHVLDTRSSALIGQEATYSIQVARVDGCGPMYISASFSHVHEILEAPDLAGFTKTVTPGNAETGRKHAIVWESSQDVSTDSALTLRIKVRYGLETHFTLAVGVEDLVDGKIDRTEEGAEAWTSVIAGLSYPVVDEPVVDEPVVDEPVVDEPVVGEPALSDPGDVEYGTPPSVTPPTDPGLVETDGSILGVPVALGVLGAGTLLGAFLLLRLRRRKQATEQ